MTTKILIAFAILLSLAVPTYLIWSAKKARKASSDILAEFKKVNSSITTSTTSTVLDSTDSHASELGLKANLILAAIENIQSEIRPFAEENQPKLAAYQDKIKIITLKKSLDDYNSFIRDYYPKKILDPSEYIDIANINRGSKEVPWETYCFENTNAYSMLTILNYTKRKVLNLQQRAIAMQ